VHKFDFKLLNDRFFLFLEMTPVTSLTRVLDFLFESSLSPAKNAKRLESDSDESLTRPNTRPQSEMALPPPQPRSSSFEASLSAEPQESEHQFLSSSSIIILHPGIVIAFESQNR
jgi:hypothetical protein